MLSTMCSGNSSPGLSRDESTPQSSRWLQGESQTPPPGHGTLRWRVQGTHVPLANAGGWWAGQDSPCGVRGDSECYGVQPRELGARGALQPQRGAETAGDGGTAAAAPSLASSRPLMSRLRGNWFYCSVSLMTSPAIR